MDKDKGLKLSGSIFILSGVVFLMAAFVFAISGTTSPLWISQLVLGGCLIAFGWMLRKRVHEGPMCSGPPVPLNVDLSPG